MRNVLRKKPGVNCCLSNRRRSCFSLTGGGKETPQNAPPNKRRTSCGTSINTASVRRSWVVCCGDGGIQCGLLIRSGSPRAPWAGAGRASAGAGCRGCRSRPEPVTYYSACEFTSWVFGRCSNGPTQIQCPDEPLRQVRHILDENLKPIHSCPSRVAWHCAGSRGRRRQGHFVRGRAIGRFHLSMGCDQFSGPWHGEMPRAPV